MTAEVRDVRRTRRGRRLHGWGRGGGGRKKTGYCVLWTTSELSVTTPTSGPLHPRGRGRMAQGSGRRRGTLHGELDRCKKVKAGLQHAVVVMLGDDSTITIKT